MQTTAPSSESRYDLYLRAGRKIGFYVRNVNRGVTLSADRINWTFAGKDDGAPYRNIRAVHLQTGGDWREPASLCTITFADGYRLLVVNSDGARRPIYRDFVRDLHGRLAAAQSLAIFTSGYRGFRYALVISCAALLGVICIGIPIAGMIVQRGIGPVTAMLAGVALYWPLARMISRNAPRTYDPRNPPQELLGPAQ